MCALIRLNLLVFFHTAAATSFLYRRAPPRLSADKHNATEAKSSIASPSADKHDVMESDINSSIANATNASWMATEPVFEDYARRNVWGSHESISGKGSEKAATVTVRQYLGSWIAKYGIKVFADIPCGDANWQGLIPGLESTHYYGFDISPTAVATARMKNSQRPFMSFSQFDLTTGVPPIRPNIIMLRDVIQHVPLQSGLAMLMNAKGTGARWLAVSTWYGGKNVEVPPGGMYQHDVHAPPFSLPAAVELCYNYDGHVQAAHDAGRQSHLELIDLFAWNPR